MIWRDVCAEIQGYCRKPCQIEGRQDSISLPEDAKDHPARRPYTDGKHVELTRCKHTFNPDVPFIPGGADDACARGPAPHAASALMKLLYAARLAKFDLLRPINSLARHVQVQVAMCADADFRDV